MFLIGASGALIVGIMLVLALRRWIGSLRWPLIAIFLLSMYAGVLFARASYGRAQLRVSLPDFIWLVAVNLSFFAPTRRGLRKARGAMGAQLYAFPRAANFELTWSGRAIMLMSALLFVLAFFLPFQKLALSSGLRAAAVECIGAAMLGSMGCNIAESIGRVELREGGVLRSGVRYPWAKLGKFEWMLGDPPVLRIHVRRAGSTLSDIRIECPDEPEINAILTGHGLIRW
jgi:hypothetical protein